MTTKRELEARIQELEGKLKKSVSSTKSKGVETKKLLELTAEMVLDVKWFSVKTTDKGNLAIKSFTPKSMNPYIQAHGYSFPSGKWWNKGINKDNIPNFVKDCAKLGIELRAESIYAF